MNRILVILYCVQTVALAGSINKIYWTIADLHFIYERNVTLFCNTSAVGLQKTTWMKQSDVILHQGLSFYPGKYTGNEVTDGSSLIIMNATELDFNMSYTCLSDVYSYEADLMINSSNFICLPQNTNNSWTIIGRDILVQLNLERFFPIPKCRIMLDEDMLITSQQESIHLQTIFYYGTMNITSKSGHGLCNGNLTVVCLFRGLYSYAIEHKILQNFDESEFSEYGLEFDRNGFGYEGTIIGVFTSCVILCFLYFLLFAKSQKENETTEGTADEMYSLTELEPQQNGHQTDAKNEREQKTNNTTTEKEYL